MGAVTAAVVMLGLYVIVAAVLRFVREMHAAELADVQEATRSVEDAAAKLDDITASYSALVARVGKLEATERERNRGLRA